MALDKSLWKAVCSGRPGVIDHVSLPGRYRVEDHACRAQGVDRVTRLGAERHLIRLNMHCEGGLPSEVADPQCRGDVGPYLI